MEYYFSANFLKIQSPDTSFGQAWESLCFDLLKAEYGDASQIRFRAPDKGIDIYRQTEKIAYQCKSNELAKHGTIDVTECIKSINTALLIRDSISWEKYFLATNSDLSGTGYAKLQDFIKENKLSNIEQLGPEYWSDLCKKHIELVKDRLDYRLLLTEQQVIEAFKKARYFDKYIQKFSEQISTQDYFVEVINNRTPLQLKIPFSPDLTIRNLLDVVKNILNINMARNNYYDTQTSAVPYISLLFKDIAQPFSKKLKELTEEEQPKLEFWIKIVWKDETEKESNDSDDVTFKAMKYLTIQQHKRDDLTLTQREEITIGRTKRILQSMIWEGVNNLIQL